jgi:exopolysaccharide production protein ExoQ
MTLAIDARSPGVPLNKLLYLFYVTGFLFVGGGFVLLTSTSDLRLTPEPGAGSLLSQSILALFYSAGTVLLLVNVHALRVFRKAWPVLLLPLLALISVCWSADPSLSLRRAVAFSGTVLFGLSLGAAYSGRDLIGLITRSMVLASVFSCAIVVVAPLYGVHQPGDAIQAVHAGLWRGIFGHRNTLGLWAGVTVASLLLFGQYAFDRALLRALSLLIGLACLVGANSGAGYAICATMILIGLLLIGFVRQPASRQGLYVFVAIVGAIIVLLLRDTFESWTLSLLGKDSDLTGRTLLWYYILQIAEKNNFLLGGGYFVGFVSLNTEIGAIMQTTFGSAHNGYLETLVYTGYVGLAVCIAVLVWLAYRAVRHMRDHATAEPCLRIFPLTFISVVAVHNFVESTIILPNNLNTLLISIVAGALALPNESAIGDET